jgi:hypothetical protein
MRPMIIALIAALALAVPPAPCAEEARALLRAHHPPSAAAVDSLDDPAFFDRWLSCEEGPPFGVTLAVHEVVHRNGGYAPGGRVYAIALAEGQHTLEWGEALFPRSELLAMLDPSERGPFATAYLEGPAGRADALLALDELNAYVRALDAEVALRRALPLPDGQLLGARDGVAVWMYWTALYVKRAREAHPSAWARLAQPDAAALIAAVWRSAEQSLARACPAAGLGIDDGWYLARAYDPALLAELSALLPDLDPTLPAACAPRVARAAPPDPSNGAAVTRVATWTEVVERREVSVVVNGEELSVDEVRQRAATDPRYAEVLAELELRLAQP